MEEEDLKKEENKKENILIEAEVKELMSLCKSGEIEMDDYLD